MQTDLVRLPKICRVCHQQKDGLNAGVRARVPSHLKAIPKKVRASAEIRLGIDLVLRIWAGVEMRVPHCIGVGKE